MAYSSSKALNISLLLFALGVFAVEARRLPSFNVLKGSYPGRSQWGGLYSDEGLVKDVGATNATYMPNDTCPLRISTMLNLITYHVITALPPGRLRPDQYFTKTFENKKDNSSVDIYFLLDIEALIAHFEKVYGIPLESDEPSAFVGRKGIMLMNVTDVAAGTDACRALLWDGYGFHQAIGYLAHTNMSKVYFWQTPDEECTIKVKSDSGGGLCFPSESTVELETGEKMKIKDLQVGQRVKTINPKGVEIFTQVVTFLDKSEEHVGQYLTIFTQSGQRITMKPSHLIFKFQTDVTSKKLFKSQAVYASTVKPGDYVYTQATRKGFAAADRVVAVALGNSRGAFAPVTSEGTFFVDEVLVSCFADLVDHDLAHSLMSPFRVLYSLVPNSFGAAGHHLHKYLKTIIRPIGLKVLGEDHFYKGLFQDQKNKTVQD